MKIVQRASIITASVALICLTASCSAPNEPPAQPEASQPSCPNGEPSSTVTGASLAASYPLLANMAQHTSCLQYIPGPDLQQKLGDRITSGMDVAERIAIAEELTGGAPDGLEFHDVGRRSDNRYAFVFTRNK